MDNLPEIPFVWIDTIIVGLAAAAFLAIHLWHALRLEVQPRRCVFCHKSVPAADYEHHLEVCGLTKGCVRQAPPEPKITGVSAGGTGKKRRHGGDGTMRSPVLRRVTGEDKILYMRYRLISEAGRLLFLVQDPRARPDRLTVKNLDGTAVFCEAPNCGRPALYLLSAGKPAVLHFAYCGVHATLFTGGMPAGGGLVIAEDYPSFRESPYSENRQSAIIAKLPNTGADVHAEYARRADALKARC
jgi:hypothetical protein